MYPGMIYSCSNLKKSMQLYHEQLFHTINLNMKNLFVNNNCNGNGNSNGYGNDSSYSDNSKKEELIERDINEWYSNFLLNNKNYRFFNEFQFPYLPFDPSNPQFYINGNLENELFFNTMHNHDDVFNEREINFNIHSSNNKTNEFKNGFSSSSSNSSGSDEKKKSLFENFLNAEENLLESFEHHLGTRFIHPFSNGRFIQFVNHYSKSNAISLPLTLKVSSVDPSLIPYIPNKFIQKDGNGISSSIHLTNTIVFIAERDLSNEFVYVNKEIITGKST
jgi:hypothetical protein